MKRTVLALALVAASTVALAQATGGGPGAGSGYGPGMGYGAGMGPGMMGYGAGMGHGMMGYGAGMGHGMMGYGAGMGPGMMGGGPGYGPRGGPGYGGGGMAAIADLSDEQRDKISAIQEEYRRKNWDTMGQLRAEEFKLRRIYAADPLDPNAVAEQQKKVDELRRQMLKSRAEQHNQVVATLTPEQRKKVRQAGPWWLREERDE